MRWFELEKEAERQGKVSYLKWKEARRRGIDPSTLVEEERRERAEFEQERIEYEAYVVGVDRTNESEYKRQHDD